MLKMELTDKKYWEEGYQYLGNSNQTTDSPEFTKLLSPYLSNFKMHPGRLLEIGCLPGLLGASLAVNYNLQPIGVDYVDCESLYLASMQKEGVRNAHFYHCDIRDFNPNEKYDVVCSFGFIEHFEDYESIFAKHVELCKTNGIVIITVPNFRKFQFLFRRLLDPACLKKHNLKVMDIKLLQNLAKENGLRVLLAKACGSINFWVSKDAPLVSRAIAKLLRPITNAIGKWTSPFDNFYISPHLLLVGEKQAVKIKGVFHG